MKSCFNQSDCQLLGTLDPKADSEIVYESYSHIIYWADEWPMAVRMGLRNFLDYQSLFRQRARLFFNADLHETYLNEPDEHDQAVWEWTKEHVPSWIGFTRTKLTPEEIEAVKRMRAEGII